MEATAATFNKNIGKMRDIKRWGVWIMMREKIDRFRATLPLIQDLRNPAMRDRHWDMVRIARRRAHTCTQPPVF
jgi:dynein heavy chain